MNDQQQGANHDLQRQIDSLSTQVSRGREAIEALQSDAADARDRADRSDARADATDVRIDGIETAATLDRQLIAELQEQGAVTREHTAQLEKAVQSSRTIGTALGFLMAERHISQDEAYTVLKVASRNSNRKMRDVASELLEMR